VSKVRVGLIGVGNCVSSLVQGIYYYSNLPKHSKKIGIMHDNIGGFSCNDIEFVSAYDVDARKVGLRLDEAIFSKPNCTQVFYSDVPEIPTIVKMGCVSDGVSEHMSKYENDRKFILSNDVQASKQDVINHLRDTKTEVLMNYLPVGSQNATEFYAECALEAGVAFVNNIPVFIASNPQWENKFREKNIPIIGDDIKAQVGATIVHRALMDLFTTRGVDVKRTYQLNTGGNTDFLNMLNRNRLESKKISKTEAVKCIVNSQIKDNNIHVGPSDYVPWQNDNKLCFIRIEGEMFGRVPMNVELRLSVEDSPNSAGIAIDSIRCAKIALDRKVGGSIIGPAAYFCKHPPVQYKDFHARILTDCFIEDIDLYYNKLNDFKNYIL